MDSLSMKEAAIAMHEMFMSFIEAGFTREEALELLKPSMGKNNG